MLRTALLATTAAVALASSAFAADLPSRRAPAPYVAVPVFTWTGFYIGGNAGYGFSDSGRVLTTGQVAANDFTVGSGARPGSVRLDQDGFTGGGQIGYNYQIGNIVIGIEADAQYTDLTRTLNVVATGPGAPGAASLPRNNVFRSSIDYIGTVRGRVGYAFDRVMVYGTGGFAYGDVTQTADFFGPQPAATNVLQFTGRRSSMETGYAAGAGIEYALPNFNFFGSSAVTLKAEALYYDLGRRTVAVNVIPTAVPVGVGTGYNSRFETNGVLARAGINFKFGTF